MMTSEHIHLPDDVESALRHYAEIVREDLGRGLPVNTNGSLVENLRHLAVEHNIRVADVHERFLSELGIALLDSDKVAELLRGPLHALRP
jgi:hypothetical protein